MTSDPHPPSRPAGARLGIGLAAVARPAYITSGRAGDLGAHRSVEDLRQRTWAVLDAAVSAGIGYVDAARSYGRAEEFLASWLQARPDVTVEIGSKWGYRYVGDWRLDADTHEVKDHSLAAFDRQRDETLALLGERLAVYHVHSATLETGVLDDAPLHRAMAGLRERGVAVGVSTSGPDQAAAVRKAATIQVDGEPLVTSFQSTWNVLETSAGDALAEVAATGARVLVKEGVANGRLTPGGEDSPGARRVTEIATSLGVGTDVLALAAALARPWSGVVLSGAVTPAQVASNAAAARLDVPAAVLDELAGLAEDPVAYWGARSQRPWG